MSDKRKPVHGGNRERAQAGAGFSRSSTSTNHSTTSAAGRQIQIADFLLRGQKNALPLRHLKEMTGLPGRDLRRQIEVARLAGVPICSGEHGYFLAENQHEVSRFVASMKRRAKRIQAVAAAVEEAEIN